MIQDTIQERKTENKEGEPYITKKGDPFVRYKIGNEWITDFSNSQFPKGALVNFDTKTEGEFKNITTITSAEPDIQTADKMQPQGAIGGSNLPAPPNGDSLFAGIEADLNKCIEIATKSCPSNWATEDLRTVTNALFIETRRRRG